ncbi:hypothetical protein ACJX0J_035108 [Zea mays]
MNSEAMNIANVQYNDIPAMAFKMKKQWGATEQGSAKALEKTQETSRSPVQVLLMPSAHFLSTPAIIIPAWLMYNMLSSLAPYYKKDFIGRDQWEAYDASFWLLDPMYTEELPLQTGRRRRGLFAYLSCGSLLLIITLIYIAYQSEAI